MKQHILVTGGAGYIGSHVARAFMAAGYVPVVVDDLSSGHAWAATFGVFVQGDIADVALVRGLCEQYKPVGLVHLAAFIEVAESQSNPDKYWRNNRDKARVLFETVRDAGVKYVVFSSTAAVYGVPTHGGALTEDDPKNPINVYGETKLAAEKILQTLDGVSSVALRYFNAAGASADGIIGEAHWPESHLIPNIILGVMGLKPPVHIMGTDYDTPDGTCVRDYVHVEDLADAHARALRYLLEGGVSMACNLGSGGGYSVMQVVQAVERCVGRDIEKEFGVRRAGDPPKLVAAIDRTTTVLGWQPVRGLDVIVRDAWAWHNGERYKMAIQQKKI